MPNASAPNAPWVEVWESPQTTVMPGWVSPSCGPTMCTIPCSMIAERCSRTPNSAQLLAQRVDLGPRHRVGDGLVDVERGHVVVLDRQRQVGPAHRAAGLAQPVERLRARHLVDEVEVDVQQVRLTGAARTTWASQTFSLRVGPLSAHLYRLPTVVARLVARRLDCPSSAPSAQAAPTCIHIRDGSIKSMDNSSGVGVLDKAALVLAALETGPATLAGLVAGTGLARPTAHRLAVALEHHRLVSPDLQGRFILGPRLGELASAAGEDRLLATAGPVLARLRDITGESAQMFRRQGDYRVCVATAERMSGLRDTVPVGTQLTMSAGSAAQILLAWEEPDRMHRGLRGAGTPRPRWPPSAAAAGPTPSASASPASRRSRRRSAPRPERSSPRCPCRARSSGCAVRPAGCTPPP